MLAYRSSIHESTGQTPVAMMFGREVTLPIDLLLGWFLDQNQGTTDIPYIMGLKQSLKEIHEIASENLENKIQLNSKVKIVHHDRLKLAYDSKVINSMDSIPTDLGQAVVDSETVEDDLESDLNHEVALQGVTTRSGRKTRLPKKLQDCIL